jgi:diguanylate cyclase
VHDQELFITPSIGISLYPLHGNNAQTLITRADAAMYNAKQVGRNNFQVFTPEMSTFYPERLLLENDLRKALERHEFELHYQPKADVQNGVTIGMEALIRWRHPVKGMVSPQEFIPLAEETGLIIPIGKWVINEACTQNRAWQNAGLSKLRVALNISGVQFTRTSLLDTVSEALTSSGLAPE